jgi:hypothetical protein
MHGAILVSAIVLLWLLVARRGTLRPWGNVFFGFLAVIFAFLLLCRWIFSRPH